MILDPKTLARLSLVGFAGYCDPSWKAFPHACLLARKLEDVAHGKTKRLLVSMPPQHGKSQLVSRFFPAWVLGNWPDRRIILASYEASFAESWGRAARDVLTEHGPPVFGVKVRDDSSAAARWQIENHRGGMLTAGAMGPITGRSADLFLIDDPVKNAEEANSETYRNRMKDWYRSVALTRLSRHGAQVILMTRWHEDDLVGWLKREALTGAPPWEELVLPALAEEGDPLGRALDEPLCPDLHPLEKLMTTKRVQGSYYWSAQYQQRPTPASGDKFKREWFRYYKQPKPGQYLLDTRPITREGLRTFATVDLAASLKTSADYTVVMAFGALPDGSLLVLDVLRARIEGPDIVPAIRRMVEKWDCSTVWIEKVGFQLALIDIARRERLPVREIDRGKDDKTSRALAASPSMEAGQVWFPREASWLSDLETELLSFDKGQHDDQVDALVDGILLARSQLRTARAYAPTTRAPLRSLTFGQ